MLQAGGSLLAVNADFGITECLSGSMEQGITGKRLVGTQYHDGECIGDTRSLLAGCLCRCPNTAMSWKSYFCSCLGHERWMAIR